MYLYFDRTGVLKEIINDEALRQGNYGINKMYIYIENRTYSSIAVSYVNSEGDILGPQSYNTFTNPSATTPAENCYIPYNPERDLKYFKYWTAYKFLIIDLEVTVTELNGVEVALGPGPLDVAGIVHCSLSATLENSAILQLGDVNFKVQPSPGLNNEVAPEHYLSLSNYLYLQSELNRKQQKLYRHDIDLQDHYGEEQFSIYIINHSSSDMTLSEVKNEVISNKHIPSVKSGFVGADLENPTTTYYHSLMAWEKGDGIHLYLVMTEFITEDGEETIVKRVVELDNIDSQYTEEL